jgi:hypothetical protein
MAGVVLPPSSDAPYTPFGFYPWGGLLPHATRDPTRESPLNMVPGPRRLFTHCLTDRFVDCPCFGKVEKQIPCRTRADRRMCFCSLA